MPHAPKYVPKHRAPGRHKAVRKSTLVLRRTALATGVAAVATGAAVGGGVLDGASTVPLAAEIGATDIAAAAGTNAETAKALASREAKTLTSRADRRGTTDRTKVAVLSVAAGAAVRRSEDLSEGDPREIAKVLLAEYGYSADQFACLDALYVGESNWRVNADNPTSSAYGIPQALTQLHDLPADYMTSAEAQIRWGLDYIKGRYGTPCNANAFKRGHGYY